MSEAIALECVKIAATLVNRSVADPEKAIAECSQKLYIHIMEMATSLPVADTQRGRPRKPREIQGEL